MAVITFSSPKGGSGKTTSALLAATELAAMGASVTIIDADPNEGMLDWSRLADKPENISVIGGKDFVTDDNIIDLIKKAGKETQFVIVDLEGSANLRVSYAVSLSDFVVLPLQGSTLDAKQTGRLIKLLRDQSVLVGREIPYSILYTCANPAYVGSTMKYVEALFRDAKTPAFSTKIVTREAYKALFTFGGGLSSLAPHGVGNLTTARSNALEFVEELVKKLRESKSKKQLSAQDEDEDIDGTKVSVAEVA